MDSNEKVEKISFFLFINSKSGGGVGRKYLTVKNRKLAFQYGKNTTICLHFIDLFSAEQKADGLEKMRKVLAKIDRGSKGRATAIICGGDGTVVWVVSIIGQYGIDLNKITFCIIPIGTGNDFSRCLGWGGSPISFSSRDLSQLKERLLQWLEAEQSWFDLWHSSISTYQEGEIIHIRDRREVSTNEKQLDRGFCNYLGLGIDARIAYHVQLNRQKNKWLNLFLYGCIGFCKLFQRIRKTNEAIHTFEEESSDGQEAEKGGNGESPLLRDNRGKIQLRRGYGNLLALNSVRYMAGLQNVWSTSKLGIVTKEQPQFADQRFDDGKIQFLAFKNELQLGLERFGNFGARVAQGEGPYLLQFNRSENGWSSYIHIDGEAIKVRQLREIGISKSKLAPNGRIRVLLKRTIRE